MPYIHVEGKAVSPTDPLPSNIHADGKEVGSAYPLPSKAIRELKEVSVLPSASRTVSGSADPLDCDKYTEAVAFLNVTNVTSGLDTTTLDVKFQTQDPISLEWFDMADLTFTQATAASKEKKDQSGMLGKKLRCVYTINGDQPDVTFSVGLILKS
jgi:hypothetical protein